MVPQRRLLIHRHPSARRLPAGYRALVPPQLPCTVPLVLVHGNQRRAGRLFRAFVPQALMLGVPVIAPTFDRDRFPGYQRLAGKDGPLAAIAALEALLADAHDELGLDTSHVDLMGYSAGAQFVHRHLLVAGKEVRRAVVAGAGWYTYLDPTRPFPRGTAPAPKRLGRPIDPQGLLERPVHVLVGAKDVGRGPAVRASRGLDVRQGPDRLTRALRWVDHLEEQAQRHGVPSLVSFDLLPDSGHGLTSAVRVGGLVQRTLSFLHAPPAHLDDLPYPHGSLQ